MSKNHIIVKGARQHNLQNIDVKIPRDKLVVITGLSGSGKSSLAFDTIYAEGQRRYVESLSAYARQFLGQMDKPDVDYIEGLSPAISIDQKTTSHNPRSTVGTVTEIHDYLRLLFARIGRPHCPKCGKPISKQTVDQIVDKLLLYPNGTKMQILSPLVRGRKGEYTKLFRDTKAEGYLRVSVDGEIYSLDDNIILDKQKKHNIEVVVDRLIMRDGIGKRLADSLETALAMSGGWVSILLEHIVEENDESLRNEEEKQLLKQELLSFNQNFACSECNISIEELTPRMFSFNNPYGACPTCAGLGFTMKIDPELLLPKKELSLNGGGLAAWNSTSQGWYFRYVEALAEKYGFSMDVPIKDLSKQALDYILYGSGDDVLTMEYEDSYGHHQVHRGTWEGVVNNFERRYRETTSGFIRSEIERFMSVKPCPDCNGDRLKPESLAVTIADKNIAELSKLTILGAQEFFDKLVLTEREDRIAQQILKEIKERLNFLVNVGLDYLSLSRASGTLSGGEAQRIRLATQIGSSLMGVLYILDEPSIGLHQRDNAQLIATLKRLRDLGNTVLVVEHDEETMLEADYIIDIGPGAGVHGGRLVASGTPAELMGNENSVTAAYLSGRKSIEIPPERRKPNGKWIVLKGAEINNLKNIDVAFPLGVFTCVTGVSGSGKSSLVNEVLYKVLAHELNGARDTSKAYTSIEGLEYLEKVIEIDQSPIGRTPRSNPATYTGVFSLIRELFAQSPDAKMRGYKPGRFSFNVAGGRCEACQGDGIIKIEMHFLPDVYVPCEVCKGKRYNRETLDIYYKGKNIADVLAMTVDEAADFFTNIPRIYKKLKVLQDVGLGYIKLGQSATTLSGGEAQRVKLATELSRRSDGRSMYILDEPTTGLHVADIKKLLQVLNRLVDSGNTVLVIEHNLDVIKSADYIIDLGPEGGNRGGEVIFTGTLEEIAKYSKSYTGQFVDKILLRDKNRQQ
ncbi:MAG: excinuclease ABC subunit UvrA [Clostridia bacterium]|nr:excinuclease ABC subunit UvrA [Clostridia bacterium]